jgi:predicted Zn-dependent protease
MAENKRTHFRMTEYIKKITARLVLLALILFIVLQGLAYKQPALAFSVGTERELGEQLLTMVRRSFNLIDEPDVVQYINELGDETLAIVGSQFYDYHFFVIRNKELNAFAAPSGLIFFHSGLIESLDSENGLVGVLAHEIGHVVGRHLANRMDKSAKINAMTLIGVLAGIAIGAGDLSQALVSGSMAAGQSAVLSFSRLDEEEADRLAFKWMQELDRDPAAMVDMLRGIRNVNRYRQGTIPAYLLTHPGPDMRMGYIQDLILFSDKKQYRVVDGFEFQRIKQRIISITKDPIKNIPFYKSGIVTGQEETADTVMLKYGLSQAYLVAAEYDKAEKMLREVISYYPTKPILKTDLGVIYYKSGRYEEGLELLSAARRLEPKNAFTIYNLALTLEKVGKLEEAVALYKELVLLIPDFTKIYFQLGNIMVTHGNKGEGFYNLGIYSWYEGDLTSAKHHLMQATKHLPADSKLHENSQKIINKIAKYQKQANNE